MTQHRITVAVKQKILATRLTGVDRSPCNRQRVGMYDPIELANLPTNGTDLNLD